MERLKPHCMSVNLVEKTLYLAVTPEDDTRSLRLPKEVVIATRFDTPGLKNLHDKARHLFVDFVPKIVQLVP